MKMLAGFVLRMISVVPALLMCASCAVNPVTGQKELMLLSEGQELAIGREASPSLQWEFGGYYHDSLLEAYLGSIVKRLWANSERPHLPVTFHIQNSSIPNAFAVPGYVAITRGLLSELQNEAQFAAVMGHEIGHVMARHTAQRLSRVAIQQLGLAIGAAALEGKEGGEALLRVGAVGSSLVFLKYDRDQEIQSDRLGVRYMSRLGYDPREAIAAHTLLEKAVDGYLKRAGKTREEDNFINRMLSTHPRAEVRIGELQGMIGTLPPYDIQDDGRCEERFLDATGRIRDVNRVYFIYDEAETLYQRGDFAAAGEALKKAMQLDPSQAPFHGLMGFVKLQQKDNTGAEESFRNALALDVGHQPSVYGLGLVRYLQKRYNEAVEEFKKSLDLYPDHVQSHFGTGKSYFHMKRCQDAIPHLQNVSGTVPRHPEVHGLLGMCHEEVGDTRRASMEYNLQLQVAPDTELGRHARGRLAVINPDRP